MTPAIVELDAARIELANAVYAAIAFQYSDPERDRTFAVLEAGAPVALGRVQRHADGSLELGGFWVRDDRRRRGLARAMVRHVLEACADEPELWCVPFEHLTEFYASFGMQRVEPGAPGVPRSIAAKLAWCAAREDEGAYANGTELLVLRPRPE